MGSIKLFFIIFALVILSYSQRSMAIYGSILLANDRLRVVAPMLKIRESWQDPHSQVYSKITTGCGGALISNEVKDKNGLKETNLFVITAYHCIFSEYAAYREELLQPPFKVNEINVVLPANYFAPDSSYSFANSAFISKHMFTDPEFQEAFTGGPVVSLKVREIFYPNFKELGDRDQSHPFAPDLAVLKIDNAANYHLPAYSLNYGQRKVAQDVPLVALGWSSKSPLLFPDTMGFLREKYFSVNI